MSLAGQQLVLDTNILVHLLRGRGPGVLIDQHYGIAQRRPRAVVPVVVKGELKALAYKLGWGPEQHRRLDAMMSGLPAVDISSAPVIGAYAEIDHVSHQRGVTMGKNDLWIAAATKVLDGVLLTTDADFDHLKPGLVRVERLCVTALRDGVITVL